MLLPWVQSLWPSFFSPWVRDSRVSAEILSHAQVCFPHLKTGKMESVRSQHVGIREKANANCYETQQVRCCILPQTKNTHAETHTHTETHTQRHTHRDTHTETHRHTHTDTHTDSHTLNISIFRNNNKISQTPLEVSLEVSCSVVQDRVLTLQDISDW